MDIFLCFFLQHISNLFHDILISANNHNFCLNTPKSIKANNSQHFFHNTTKPWQSFVSSKTYIYVIIKKKSDQFRIFHKSPHHIEDSLKKQLGNPNIEQTLWTKSNLNENLYIYVKFSIKFAKQFFCVAVFEFPNFYEILWQYWKNWFLFNFSCFQQKS